LAAPHTSNVVMGVGHSPLSTMMYGPANFSRPGESALVTRNLFLFPFFLFGKSCLVHVQIHFSIYSRSPITSHTTSNEITFHVDVFAKTIVERREIIVVPVRNFSPGNRVRHPRFPIFGAKLFGAKEFSLAVFLSHCIFFQQSYIGYQVLIS